MNAGLRVPHSIRSVKVKNLLPVDIGTVELLDFPATTAFWTGHVPSITLKVLYNFFPGSLTTPTIICLKDYTTRLELLCIFIHIFVIFAYILKRIIGIA